MGWQINSLLAEELGLRSQKTNNISKVKNSILLCS